jgi:hypothetical protein
MLFCTPRGVQSKQRCRKKNRRIIYARHPTMEIQASLPWLALTMTSGIAARLLARLLRESGSPDAYSTPR